MTTTTTDRRVLRTRKQLQDALLSVIMEKGYEIATVQDIIDRANVGRSTFYAHFADKQTLLTSTLEDLRDLLMRQQIQGPSGSDRADGPGLGFSLAMLQHARSSLPLWHAIVGRESGGFILQQVQRTIVDLAMADLDVLGFKGGTERRKLAGQYIAAAFMAVLTWWLNQGARLPPQEVDLIFRRLVMHGLATDLGFRPDAA